MLYAIAEDNILPKWFCKTNRDGNPYNAVFFIMAMSAVIPFFGRTAISWIVDVTTVGGIIIYCYTSAVALKVAIGVAEYDKDSDKNLDDVFVRADAAMYEQKSKIKKAKK